MSVSHSPDVGGRLLSADSREVFEEGFRLPIMKLFKAGEPNEDLFRIIRLNVRVPDIVVGDLMAQLASNTIMARRLVEFLEAKGLDDADALFSAVWERSDLAMRQAIAKIPPGTYRGEVETDGFDQPDHACAARSRSRATRSTSTARAHRPSRSTASTARSAGRSRRWRTPASAWRIPPPRSTARR